MSPRITSRRQHLPRALTQTGPYRRPNLIPSICLTSFNWERTVFAPLLRWRLSSCSHKDSQVIVTTSALEKRKNASSRDDYTKPTTRILRGGTLHSSRRTNTSDSFQAPGIDKGALCKRKAKSVYFQQLNSKPLGGIGCIGVTAHAYFPSLPRNLVTHACLEFRRRTNIVFKTRIGIENGAGTGPVNGTRMDAENKTMIAVKIERKIGRRRR
ncbi:hypothetical protein EVAR_49316_1 [Eumeta japonica]|uniref:Uncharacterized protein n=1 Tax=Eumeta variegata TaxID=151549 RepID=A0A4C1Y9T9_EUMVA|nr:hypothetical protein EVAR_49316_1 [Eumeta japonica]